ncbi:MAG TPA: hypothetical protein DCP84_05470 [Pseudomonas sp.]|nr:hypothetical protein [Pseudomonas sp.]
MHVDCDERAAHGLAISSVQRWHLGVLGAAADGQSASRVLVYLCSVKLVYKTQAQESQFHASSSCASLRLFFRKRMDLGNKLKNQAFKLTIKSIIV